MSKTHLEEREIKEGYCPECGCALPAIGKPHNTELEFLICRNGACRITIEQHYEVSRRFIGTKIRERDEHTFGHLLQAATSQHRSGIGEEEIVLKWSTEDAAGLPSGFKALIHLDKECDKYQIVITNGNTEFYSRWRYKTKTSARLATKTFLNHILPSKIDRSHPTTPNAPSPEVIEKLVEALGFYADKENHREQQDKTTHRFYCLVGRDDGDKAQFALALIDGEKK